MKRTVKMCAVMNFAVAAFFLLPFIISGSCPAEETVWEKAGLREYIDSKSNVSFLVPKEFTEAHQGEKKRFKSPEGAAFITYQAMEFKKNGGLYTDAKEMIDYLSAKMKKEFSADIKSIDRVEVAGLPGYRMRFAWSIEGEPLAQEEVVLEAPECLYSMGLASASTHYDKYLDLFKTAVSSFTRGKSMGVPAAGVPSAALLPWRTYRKDLALYGYTKLTGKLTEENLFTFVPREEVTKTMKELNIPEGVNMKNDQLQALGDRLGVNFVLWGNFNVIKDLSLIGFRQDIGIKTRIFSVSAGKDHCRSAAYYTGMLFVKPSKIKDGEYMTDLAVDHVLKSFKKRMNPDAPRPKSSREKARDKKGRRR